MLGLLCKAPSNSQFLIEQSFEIFLQICMPAISLTQAESEMFEEDSVEFVNLSQDVCNEQESESIKTHAA